MGKIIPWHSLLAVIKPFSPAGKRERMLRMYFLQQWYGLAGETLADAIWDSQAMQGFPRINLATSLFPS